MNRHFYGHFALVPQRDRSKAASPKICVVVEKAIALSIDIRRSDYDCVREFFFDSLFSIILLKTDNFSKINKLQTMFKIIFDLKSVKETVLLILEIEMA